MVIEIMQDTPSSKVSSSWRMARRLELIETWLIHHRVITLKHIRRDGNKVANLLANFGVECGVNLHTGSITGLVSNSQLKDFQNNVKKEMMQEGEEHPDAGDSFHS